MLTYGCMTIETSLDTYILALLFDERGERGLSERGETVAFFFVNLCF